MSVAKSYARALLESATESGMTNSQCEGLEKQLERLVDVVESSRPLAMALMGPAASAKEKVAVLNQLGKALSLDPLLVRFLELMGRKRRLDLISQVSSEFRELRLERDGIVLGEMVSAEPLSATDVEDLGRAFGQRLGVRVSFVTKEDPALLAGVKVTVGGVTYDGTMRSQLNRLRDTLVQSSGAGLH